MLETDRSESDTRLAQLSRYTYHSTTEWGRRKRARSSARIWDKVLPPLPAGSRVLEIGSGRGEFAREALRRGLHYEGIEPSAELRARLEADGIRIWNAAVPPLPVPDESVDLVHSRDLFEHLVDYREALALCEEAYRALRPGGYLSIMAPNFDSLGWVFFAHEYQHGFVTNRSRLSGLLRDSGFAIEKSIVYLTPLGLNRWWPLDRIVTHAGLAVLGNRLVCDLIRGAGGERFFFRAHKNLCDHVVVVGRKPGRMESEVRAAG